MSRGNQSPIDPTNEEKEKALSTNEAGAMANKIFVRTLRGYTLILVACLRDSMDWFRALDCIGMYGKREEKNWRMEEKNWSMEEKGQSLKDSLKKSMASIAKSHKKRDGRISYEEIRNAINCYRSDMEIGRGAGGKMYKAILHGQKFESTRMYFEKTEEISLTELKLCLEYKHDNVEKMMGFCVVGDCEWLYIVTELIGGLELKPRTPPLPPPVSKDSSTSLTSGQKIHTLLWAARILDHVYNSNKPFFYMDLMMMLIKMTLSSG